MDTRPNILLISTDQQRWDTIHAGGNPHIFTPNLNWLCDTGIQFSRAYSDCPVCMPARATIMTGLPAYAHGSVGNSMAEPMRGRETLPELLAKTGYQTRAQGKMHFHPMRKKYGFEEMELSFDYHRFMQRHYPGHSSRPPGAQNQLEPTFAATSSPYTQNQWVVDRSIDFLDTRDEERPFFLWSSFSKPHPPLDADAGFRELYCGIPMPAPFQGEWSSELTSIPTGFLEPTATMGQAYRFSSAQLAAIRRAYYACISEVDAAIGQLFTYLRESGRLRDTWIIFTSDHGEMLGDHQMCSKGVPLEGSSHIPLLLRPPGEWDDDPRRGQVCKALVCLQDILPTCLNVAGVKVEGLSLPGFSLLDVQAGGAKRNQLISQYKHLYAANDGQWKYLYSSLGPAELLFEIGRDTQETCNLASREPEKCSRYRSMIVQTLREHGNLEQETLPAEPAPALTDLTRWQNWPGWHSKRIPTDLLH